MPQINTLTLRETHRAGGGGRTARTYFDFYVSGTRLLDLLGWPDADYITPLGWGKVQPQQQAIAELLRRHKPPLPTGRCLVYICPECGDIGCGAVTACIEREGEMIVWREFAFENGYEEPSTGEFAAVAPLHFDATAYWQTLSGFRPDQMRTT